MRRGTQTLLSATAALCSCAALHGLCRSRRRRFAKPSTTLTILVTNDDGVTAPGINATVQALSALPHTKVTVVAPLTNQSGTGAEGDRRNIDSDGRHHSERLPGQGRRGISR